MSVDDVSGASGAAPTGQKNSVEIFLSTLEKAIRSSRVYAYESGKAMLSNIYDNVFNACQRAFYEDDVIDVHIKPLQMIHDRRVVYKNEDRRNSLAYNLYENSVRLMSFKRGITRDELVQILKILSTDFASSENMDEDLYCLFIEFGFDHFEVVASDTLGEAQRENEKLKEVLSKFRSSIADRTIAETKTNPRKLRQDDVKVLEEFRLNPQQFYRSDDEVSKIVRTVTQFQRTEKREKETLERLVLMGFHFLLQEKELDQVQVGRELASQAGVMMLEGEFVELFRSLIKKLNQLHRDQAHLRGEFQKVLDSLFSPEHLALYQHCLQQKDHQKPLLESLLDGPPSAVRLMILLLPVAPWAPKVFAEFILKNAATYATWINDYAMKNTEEACWEPFINILSIRPNRIFQDFLTILLSSAGETMKLKILRQCAINATDDSLQVFDPLLVSKDRKERELAYSLLPLAKNKKALIRLKEVTDSKDFNSFDEGEREEVYSAILQIGGDIGYSWFENLWMKPGEGLFKAKSLNERRMILAKAAHRECPGFLNKILEKTPLDSLSKELQDVMKRQHGGANG